MVGDIIKIFIPTTLSFFISVALTFFLSHYPYKFTLWKKRAGKKSMSGEETLIFNELHKEREVSVPKMGGILIWASPLVTVLVLYLLSLAFPGDLATKLQFVSRN